MQIEENEYIPYPGIESASFTLRSESAEVPAGHLMGILSHNMEGIRSLGINVSNLDEEDGAREEACRQAIVFATRLFGGFTDETQVYDAFSQVFSPWEELAWEASIEGIDCQIKYAPDRTAKLLIALSDNLEAFTQPSAAPGAMDGA